jgi:TRAP-type C4-dicarboxylate transport system substrate-binding protein
MNRRLALLALAAVAMLAAVSGCGHSDKAGGVTSPAVLRFAASGDPSGDFFAEEVRKLSRGRIRVEVKHDPAGHATADFEVRAARMLTSGRYDLATVSADAWEAFGVRTFTPFALPFLVRDQSVLRAVLESPVPAQMLRGLSEQHVVGLAVTPGLLRHPVGYEWPVTAPAHFRGKAMNVPVSPTADALASVLGATPVHLPPGGSDERTQLLRKHRLNVDEASVYGPPNAWITANETLSAPVGTLVANGKSFARLSPGQRRILRAAAQRAAARALAVILHDFNEARGALRHCDVARMLNASPADVAALERATRPLYARLERDGQLRELIEAMEAIKARTPPDPAARIPAWCSRPVAVTKGRARSPSLLNGTSRWHGDKQIAQITLRDGKWLALTGEHGTYKIIRDRVLFRWPDGTIFTFTFKRAPGDVLDLKVVPPVPPEDAHVWVPEPWKRIGPPVASFK